MNTTQVFGCAHAFLGRDRELERIISAAHSGNSLTILAAPGVGASELLKQGYDELFLSESVLPFYFELRRSDGNASDAGKRFAHEFLVQSVAYARKDPHLIAIRPSLDEISRLAPPEFTWIDGALEALLSAPAISTCIGIAARPRRNVVVLIDGLDRVRLIREGWRFLEALTSLRGVSVIASGLRRAMYGRMPFEQTGLEPLPFAETLKIAASIADRRGVEIAEASRDLIAVQTEHSLTAIDLLLRQAADGGARLTDFATLESVYTNSIFGGHIARYLRSRILRPLPQIVGQSDVSRLLADTLRAEGKRLPMRQWRRTLREIDDAAFGRLIRHLHIKEVISAGDGAVSMAATPRVIRDYIEARARIVEAPEKRAPIVGRAMQHDLARAPRLMTEFYRSLAAIGARSLLETLQGQTIGRAAVDYAPFKAQLKGQADIAIIAALRSSTDTLDLPRVIYTADAANYYPPLAELCDRGRAAVGLAESGEAWLAAEIDSKLEADAATAEFWCDRLEMAAVYSGFDRYHIWLIAPEGFTDEALQILTERDAFGSSRRQAELMRELLSTPISTGLEAVTHYEITVAMGDEGEMIAVRTLGEIAEKHAIPAKTTAEIKTAIVEAMINAAEHSLSPDGRVALTFAATADKITISVANRGLKLTNHMLAQDDGPSERRGWGLKLIRQLMDDVRVEPTDDGTRLVMIKRFD